MNYLAEQNVIGSLLMNQSSLVEVVNDLSPEMFGSELLGRIYLEFQKAFDNGYQLTTPGIVQGISDYPNSIVLEEIRGCLANTDTSALIKQNADVMIREYKAKVFSELLNRQKVDPANVDKQIGEMITELEGMVSKQSNSGKTVADIATEFEDRYFNDDVSEKINLGFSKLDDMLSGLEGGDMIVIGARPGVGKSAFVTQVAQFISGQGKKVAFFNLEMQDKQVYERLVAAESRIKLTRIRKATTFQGDEEARYRAANSKLKANDKIVVYTGSRTISDIRTKVRHMAFDIIIIDYLQLVKSDVTYRGNRYAEVGAISKAVKALAMELNVPIIALSQLNRVSEMRENREPTMSELREAGDIEQDASVILLLWNTDTEDKSKKRCKIEKQRQGTTGTVDMRFDGSMMRFVEGDIDPDCPFV